MNFPQSRMLEKIIEITQEAGDRILQVYKSGDLRTQTKADGSPVTRADFISHEFISGELEREFGYPVLSEEGDLPPHSTRRDWTHFFLVDPLDGTKDFIAQNDQFTINVALIQNNRPVLGVVALPAMGELFFGQTGQGAWKRSGQQTDALPLSIAKGKVLARSLLHDNSMLESFSRQNSIDECIKMSSAVRLPRLAQGQINLCVISSRSQEWDIAAGHVLVAETGGQIFGMQSKVEPGYNKPNLGNEFSIACSKEIQPDDLVF